MTIGRIAWLITLLACLIALINTYNRLNVMLQVPAGDYQPGQFAQL